MLAIKLQRIGKKHQPGYRVVVAEARSKMAAPPVEDLGSYNPFTKAFAVKKERVLHWITVGAKPTATVNNLLVSHQVISGKKMAVKMKKAEKTAESGVAAAFVETTTEAPVTEAASEEKPAEAAA